MRESVTVDVCGIQYDYASMAALRRSLRNSGQRYRITRDGEIHRYGSMPNTNQIGWYLYGRIV